MSTTVISASGKQQLSKLLQFALVGGIGFIVDWLVFNGLLALGLTPLAARVPAFCVAALTTWVGNRWFTFAERPDQAVWPQLAKYGAMVLFSALPNLASFTLVVQLFGESWWVLQLALVVGILVGMISNFVISHFWIFPEQPKAEPHRQ